MWHVPVDHLLICRPLIKEIRCILKVINTLKMILKVHLSIKYLSCF